MICLLNTLEKYPSLIEESVTSNQIVLGDYNAAVHTVLELNCYKCVTHNN